MSKIRSRVFVPPSPLTVPANASFKAYLINTNGLKETTTPSEFEGNAPSKLNKLKVIKDLITRWKLDAVHLVETHDTNPVGKGPLQGWTAPMSTPEGNKHGAATATAAAPTRVLTDTNVSASAILWEDQEIWLVTAYISNHREVALETYKRLDTMFARHLKSKRIILAADFNSTETLSSFDTGGPKPPSSSKDNNAEDAQQFLDAWRLKDLWTKESNPAREEERDSLEHLTHWNHEHTRGVRIDRVYANFPIGAEVSVTTHHHPGSDHRGVLYSWANTPEILEEAPPPPLPHRAFDLKEVKNFVALTLKEFEEEHMDKDYAFPKWDKAKRLIKNFAIDAWSRKVRARGRALKRLEKSRMDISKNLHRCPLNHHSRPNLLARLEQVRRAICRAKAKDMAARKEAMQAKWIQMAGKPNKDFLAKPRGSHKKIGNMTIDNVKDKPDLPRTDDMTVILNNFVAYYGKLYEHKRICPIALNKLISNLTLTLTEDEEKILDEPIKADEMLKAIIGTPKGKSPGTDRIPYECYISAPLVSARILAEIGNMVSQYEEQPTSWGQILISVLPKEPDSYSTHKFRPISLLNTDYKLVMRVWANRLGPILANKIGHHQRGFIPGRDGRENIINVQMIIDLINARNEDGAVIFLDQEKAFDMVSFTAIHSVFAAFNWPERFKSLLNTVYRKNHIRAKVKANGIRSDKDLPVNSGTRQGCPLSPLIYAVIADLYNMAIISHKHFKGHETVQGHFVKISAYADDTAVHVASLTDIKIYKLLLRQYSLATGGVTNFNKSEAVPLGTWRAEPPDMGVKIAKSSKYLGVITGYDTEMAEKAIADREAKVYRQMDSWDARLSSSPIDRVMIAKIMCLSLVWYHASMVPNWEPALLRIEKRVQTFIWKKGIPKVAKATLHLPKKEGGLGVWSLVDKAKAFNTMWVVKLLTGKTNPILEKTIEAVTKWTANKQGTEVPLWESRLDHSQALKTLGFNTLALLQGAWANVLRRDPQLKEGDWVAYMEEADSTSQQTDTLCDGRARVLAAPPAKEDKITAEWYEPNWDTGHMEHNPLPNGEAWHMPKSKCFHLTDGHRLDSPNKLSSRPEDLYVVAGTNDEGEKVRLRPAEIHLDEEDMRPTEQYGPAFIKRNENSRLYKAQMFRTHVPYIKVNAWARDWGIDVAKARKLHLNTFAQSKVKGFMWLFCSHALPVGTRLRGKNQETACPMCDRTEDIKHMAYDCASAKDIRFMVFREWWFRTTDSFPVINPSFTEDMFGEGTNTLDVLRRTLNDITTYHIWRRRCGYKYGEGDDAPAPIIANNVWTEFTSTIRARMNHIKAKANWWRYRDGVQLVPHDVATQNLDDIEIEQNILSTLLLDWERPTSGRNASPRDPEFIRLLPTSVLGGAMHHIPPTTYSSMDEHWKLRTTPKPTGRGMLVAPGQVVVDLTGTKYPLAGAV